MNFAASFVVAAQGSRAGDMAAALERAYRSWTPAMKPPLASLESDFFERNRLPFDAAKAVFFLDLNAKGVVLASAFSRKDAAGAQPWARKIRAGCAEDRMKDSRILPAEAGSHKI